MVELEDDDNPRSARHLTNLRRELPPVGPESDRGVARSPQEVVGGGPRATAKAGRDAAERLALEQEVTALRRALAGKERTLDSISLECRRLEDAIEDEQMAAEGLRKEVEGLRKELEHNESALSAERKAAAELEHDFHEMRVRLLKRRSHGLSGNAAAGGALGPMTCLLPVLAGVAVGVTVAVAVAVGYLGMDGLRRALLGPHDVVEPAVAGVPVVSAGPGEAVSGGPAGTEPAADQVQATEPMVLRTVRDRLADGSIGPLMVALPAGGFTMGSLGLGVSSDEQPVREVRVGGFLIGANEVTFADYDRFVRATGRRSPDDFVWGRGRRPVVDVSWADAQAYAQWLSRQTGQRYRLPSEAQWEYAARGGAKSSYWWGFSPELGRALCFDCGTPWDGRSTAPVGSFEPNPYGLYDTAGNVLEWTADCYRPSYQGAPEDGTVWDQDPCGARVARGGAFNKLAKSMRSAARAQFPADTRINMLGFRLARDE